MSKKGQVFNTNDRIRHSVYGTGTIVEVNPRRTTIAFDDAGTRKFMTSMVELAPSDTPAPPKPAKSRKKAAPKK